MDIKLKSDEGSFKCRVAGCLCVDGSVLAVNICDNGFYCFPGGHVHLGEDTETAMKREFEEETSIKCNVENLFAIVENFFVNKKGKTVHEICFYYLLSCENITKKDWNIVENDEGILKNLEFKWIDIDKIDDVDFRPNKLKKIIKEQDFSFKRILVKEI